MSFLNYNKTPLSGGVFTAKQCLERRHFGEKLLKDLEIFLETRFKYVRIITNPDFIYVNVSDGNHKASYSLPYMMFIKGMKSVNFNSALVEHLNILLNK